MNGQRTEIVSHQVPWSGEGHNETGACLVPLVACTITPPMISRPRYIFPWKVSNYSDGPAFMWLRILSNSFQYTYFPLSESPVYECKTIALDLEILLRGFLENNSYFLAINCSLLLLCINVPFSRCPKYLISYIYLLENKTDPWTCLSDLFLCNPFKPWNSIFHIDHVTSKAFIEQLFGLLSFSFPSLFNLAFLLHFYLFI